jgi:uncharacterized protein (TIGR03437 family)
LTASRILFFVGALFALIFANAASAQTISIVQGNGQMICVGCAGGFGQAWSIFDDVIVSVKDANGNPVNNATVNWSYAAADGLSQAVGPLINGLSTTTGSNANAGTNLCAQAGYSCNRYTGNDTGGLTLRVIAVTATYNNKSVVFTLTETPPQNANGSIGSASAYLLTPPLGGVATGTTFSGTAGSTNTTMPIQVSVGTGGSIGGVNGVANVSVRLVPDAGTPAGSPTASCATPAGSPADPGSVLTNTQGVATCNVVFGPTPTPPPGNPVAFRVLIGGVPIPQFSLNVNANPPGFAEPGNGLYYLVVTPATPSAVQIISGNNQNANRGGSYAAPLVVRVVDANLNPLASAPLTWTVSPIGDAVIVPSGATDANGYASATVSLPLTTAGSFTVTATTSNGKAASFTLSVNVAITGITIPGTGSGNNQSVSEGQSFQPIAAQVVVGAGQSAAGIPVQFSVVSGSAILGASSAISNASGIATVNVQAGGNSGPVSILASAGSASVTFNLTVLPPGLNLSPSNFLNGASFVPTGNINAGALSPCSLGTVVIGTPLTATTLPATPNLYGAAMQQTNGTSVIFNPTGSNPNPPGAAPESAPILNVTGLGTPQTLITFQVPCDLIGGAVPVSVSLGNASTLVPVILTLHGGSPGIFQIPMSDGVRRAVAVRPDGTFVSVANPARRGEVVKIYITGIGLVSPALKTDMLPDILSPGVDSISADAYLLAEVGGVGAPVLTTTSRMSPSLIGVFEFDIMIPANAPQGPNTSLVVAIYVTYPGDQQNSINSTIPTE